MTSDDAAPESRGPMSGRRSRDRVSISIDVRFDVEAEITRASEHNFYQGFSENLSDGGLFIQTYAARKIGDVLNVQFTLPDDDEPIAVRGVVRWQRAYHEPSGTQPGLGVQFERLRPADQARVERFLSTRSPLFYDE